jgi:tRNA-dihydrouridine synthase
VKEVVEIRNRMGLKTKILGNGDVKNLAEARSRVEETLCDGVMLGRAIFGNPWLFAERELTVEEKLKVMVEHTKLYEELLGKYKNFAIMKKHYKAYVNGFDGAKELRMKLMEAENASEIELMVNEFLD